MSAHNGPASVALAATDAEPTIAELLAEVQACRAEVAALREAAQSIASTFAEVQTAFADGGMMGLLGFLGK